MVFQEKKWCDFCDFETVFQTVYTVNACPIDEK